MADIPRFTFSGWPPAKKDLREIGIVERLGPDPIRYLIAVLGSEILPIMQPPKGHRIDSLNSLAFGTYPLYHKSS